MNIQDAKKLQESINDTAIHMLAKSLEKAAKRVAEDENYLIRAVDLQIVKMLNRMLDAVIEGESASEGIKPTKTKRSKHGRKPLPKTKPGAKPHAAAPMPQGLLNAHELSARG